MFRSILDSVGRRTIKYKRGRFNITSKRGNKNFYKGRGAPGFAMGTKGPQGRFILDPVKAEKHMLPKVPDLTDFELKPYVQADVPPQVQ